MRFDEAGELKPFRLDDRCGKSCRLCRQVCPFSDDLPDEDALAQELFAGVPGIARHPITGYYLGAMVGYSLAHRERGASGGLATWTLQTLLERGEVDAVACVAPREDGHPLFEFKLCRTGEEVRACSRSAYYPVHVGNVVRQILKSPGRYAVIALPCVCKAIRLAMHKLPVLRERVRYVLGLVCGQGKSAFFAEAVCALGGGDPARLSSLVCRVKAPDRPASDFGMTFTCTHGSLPEEGTVFWTEGIEWMWADRAFTPLACDFCDDVFAECADAVFMDAWLPAYVPDSRGHNLALIRQPCMADLLSSAPSGELALRPLPIADVIRSQLGAIAGKRPYLTLRMKIAAAEGIRPPKKRTHLWKTAFQFGRAQVVSSCWAIARQSGKLWPSVGRSTPCFESGLELPRRTLARSRLFTRRMRYINRLLRIGARL
ncbi:MAG: F420H2 dehydrogenase subunit F [Planctomycetes bacterium ADurb.Bin126]|nr:MAG: F420H2 dehydrogenase subunit F [Planctomycetes bacterium ADurb.Bin126]